MEQIKNKEFYQEAMRNGTYLGIVWAVMYIMLFNSINNIVFSFAASGLFIASPFIAFFLAVRYHKTECGNLISFSQAWKFIFLMYICATLLSATTNYIYLNYIDKGEFLLQTKELLSIASQTKGIDTATQEHLDTTKELFSHFTTGSLTWEFLKANILSCMALPPIIAFFVKKKNL